MNYGAVLLLLPGILFAQAVEPKTAPKPPDALVAAYFRADSAAAAAKSQHDAMMESYRKAITDSVDRQIQTTMNALVALSALEQGCGELTLDRQALQKTGEAKCIPKEPAKPQEKKP